MRNAILTAEGAHLEACATLGFACAFCGAMQISQVQRERERTFQRSPAMRIRSACAISGELVLSSAIASCKAHVRPCGHSFARMDVTHRQILESYDRQREIETERIFTLL